MSDLKVTSFSDLQKYSKGTIVPLPPFADGQPFVARLRRPSMLKMAKEGKIPNALLESANKLFYQNGFGQEDMLDEGLLESTLDILTPIIDSALIEPTLSDIEKAGMFLSDDQIMAIFNYTQQGVKALSSFRGKSGDNQPMFNVQHVQESAQRDNGD